MASLASSGIKALSSLLARSLSRKALRVLRKSAANSAQELDELISTIRMASMRGRGGSAGELQTSAIGKVVTAAGSVTIEHASAVVVQANIPAGGVGQTKAGDLVYKGDVGQTGADGKVGISFSDGPSFNLSSNARMLLNEFVYDPNGKSNSTLFSLSKRTFTFIAGKVAKTGDMKIDTPVATMGIRGTTPHVEISDDGTVKFSTLIEENKSRVEENKGG